MGPILTRPETISSGLSKLFVAGDGSAAGVTPAGLTIRLTLCSAVTGAVGVVRISQMRRLFSSTVGN
jgi:hypothetical protein